MKRIIKYILLTVLCLGLTNCSNTENPNEELEVYYFQIDYVSVFPVNDNYDKNEYIKCLDSFSEVRICNEDTNYESVEIDYSDYNVNFDSLIGGDVLKISYYGKWIGTASLPGSLHFNATIESIEVINANIYEVIAHNDGENITFSIINEEIELDETKLNNKNLFFDNMGMANKITPSSLEDGTILYYSYNNEYPSSTTYLHSYNPRVE